MQFVKLELSKNLINQILNDDDLLILADYVQDDMIKVLPTDFAMKED